MMHRIHIARCRWSFLMAACLTVLLAGCTAGRLATSSGAQGAANAPAARKRVESPLTTLVQTNSRHTDFTARLSAELAYSNHLLPVKGNLRMRRGDVIQMAFTALGMVEVARVELTPKAVLLIDRMSKQYATVAYDQMPGLETVGLSYEMIESLLWNELFLPGQKDITTHLQLLDCQVLGQQYRITPKSQPAIHLQFTADNPCTRLQQTQLTYGPVTSTWDYSVFQTVGDSRFPAMLKASISNGTQEASATLTYTGMAFDNTEWTAHTNIANYTQLSIEDFLQKLALLK